MGPKIQLTYLVNLSPPVPPCGCDRMALAAAHNQIGHESILAQTVKHTYLYFLISIKNKSTGAHKILPLTGLDPSLGKIQAIDN